VNTYTTNSQYSAAVGLDGAGGFVVVWSSDGSSGTDTSTSVQGQRFAAATTPTAIPTLSSRRGLLLGALLMLPMVWWFRRRVVGSSASLRA
jgi:hypothetical protein